MSKQQQQQQQDAYPAGDAELPPPYSPEPPTTALLPSSTHPDSLFAAQLAAMRLRIRDQQAVQASQRERRDMHLLALLVAHVEQLLLTAPAPAAGPAQPLVEATLVPAAALPPDWTPTETLPGRLVRVRSPTPAAGGEEKKKPEGGAAGWGGDAAAGGEEEEEEEELWWWADEELAARLARLLQPEQRKPGVGAAARARAAAEARKKKAGGRSRWRIFGGRGGDGVTPAASGSAAAVQVVDDDDDDDDVAMHVTAETVTFRRETYMGLWESCSGWGVVVRVGGRPGTR